MSKRELDPARCCETVRRPPGRAFWGSPAKQCTRTPTVERNGKKYCKQHDPEAIKARYDARYKDFNRAMDERRERHEWQTAALAYCQGMTLEELKAGRKPTPTAREESEA